MKFGATNTDAERLFNIIMTEKMLFVQDYVGYRNCVHYFYPIQVDNGLKNCLVDMSTNYH